MGVWKSFDETAKRVDEAAKRVAEETKLARAAIQVAIVVSTPAVMPVVQSRLDPPATPAQLAQQLDQQEQNDWAKELLARKQKEQPKPRHDRNREPH